MKLIWVFILFVFSIESGYSQKDTINIAPFKVVEKKIPDSYKTSTFDSAVISNSINLAQLLSENSTLFIKTYGSGSLATISFRGTGASHTKVQWNGINLNSPMNGQIDFSLYPTFFFDNAQIHYGASGLIDGNGALGGSVIINNSEVYNKGLSATATQSIGSFGNFTTTAKGSYSNKKWFSETKLYHNNIENDFNFKNSSKIDSPLETQINAQLKQYGAQQSIFRKFKNSSLGARFWYFNSDRNLPHTMLISENNEKQTDESFRTSIEWKGLFKNLQYKLSSGFIKDELIYENKLANIYSKNNSYLIDNNINTKLYLKHNITLTNNVNVKYEAAEADGFSENHSRLNNSWLVGISKNFNRFNLDLFNRFIAIEKEIKPLAPSIGIRYQLLKKHLFYAKANTGINYNYPTFNDLYWNPGGNKDLKPEQAKMTEIGFSYTKTTKKTSLNTELTAFYSEVKDWIIWQPTEFGFWSPSNLKSVENKGIESTLAISTKINKLKIQNRLSYAYTKSTNKKAQNEFDNSKDKQLIYVPFHKINYSLTATFHKTTLNYSYNYTGERFTSTDNNWYLPANFISNVSIANQFRTTEKIVVTASFKINNIFDQAYQSIAWRPIPGRNYLFTLALSFN